MEALQKIAKNAVTALLAIITPIIIISNTLFGLNKINKLDLHNAFDWISHREESELQ